MRRFGEREVYWKETFNIETVNEKTEFECEECLVWTYKLIYEYINNN